MRYARTALILALIWCLLAPPSCAQVSASNRDLLVALVENHWNHVVWGSNVVEVDDLYKQVQETFFCDSCETLTMEWLREQIEKQIVDKGLGGNSTTIDTWRSRGEAFLKNMHNQTGQVWGMTAGAAYVEGQLAINAYSTWEEVCMCCKPCEGCEEVCDCNNCGVLRTETPTIYQPFVGWTVRAANESSPTSSPPVNVSDVLLADPVGNTTSFFSSPEEANGTITADDIIAELPSSANQTPANNTSEIPLGTTQATSGSMSADDLTAELPAGAGGNASAPEVLVFSPGTPPDLLESPVHVYIHNHCRYAVEMIVRYLDTAGTWRDVCDIRSGTGDEQVVHGNFTEEGFAHTVGSQSEAAGSHGIFGPTGFMWGEDFADQNALTRFPLIFYAASTVGKRPAGMLRWWGHAHPTTPEVNNCGSYALLRPFSYIDLDGDVFLHLSCDRYQRRLSGDGDVGVSVRAEMKRAAGPSFSERRKRGLRSLGSRGRTWQHAFP
ncbi:unnamed protein product [Vitrella brassicaformis CCMP3155]|uniref:PPIase cyclophilin-type domain-containing protein n=2 Tax=Vitrella brassicaformis TaxID=1169539 RepID=A0A0G4EPU6_VITBC|nr:unnamed protein product [Vitrella brassicaformis CCMP3155]|eukprot:CEL99461.1 unnamed protein product [Vitrella brassicaformis CCMP3155]